MSNINTNGLDINYPIPGINNSSQGFRDNFNNIKNNLDNAYTELTDLQSKAVVKSALTDSIVNNDMGNTLISNALVRSFRATTYPLGNALEGEVTVNVLLGDVQEGEIAGNVRLDFRNWAPTGTQSNVQIVLHNNSVPDARVELYPNITYGTATIENYEFNELANVGILTFPTGITRLHFNFSTLDCGETVLIEPLDNPRVATKTTAIKANINSVLPDTASATQGEIIFLATDETSGSFYGFNGTNWVQIS